MQQCHYSIEKIVRWEVVVYFVVLVVRIVNIECYTYYKLLSFEHIVFVLRIVFKVLSMFFKQTLWPIIIINFNLHWILDTRILPRYVHIVHFSAYSLYLDSWRTKTVGANVDYPHIHKRVQMKAERVKIHKSNRLIISFSSTRSLGVFVVLWLILRSLCVQI